MHWMTRWSVGILVSFAAIAIPGCLERPETPEERWIFANPLAVVEVGEWASYELSEGNSWRLEVVDGAGRRGPCERPIVSLAVVVTGEAKRAGEHEDQEGRRVRQGLGPPGRQLAEARVPRRGRFQRDSQGDRLQS